MIAFSGRRRSVSRAVSLLRQQLPVLLICGLSACSGSDEEEAGSDPSPPLCEVEARCERTIVEDQKVLCSVKVSDGSGAVLYDDHAGIEIRGRSSLEFPKKNYSLELRTESGQERPENLLGMGQESDWILDGSWADRSFMRNDLVYAVFREMGHYAPESRFCKLRLNERPQGIYRLSERIKRDDDRVNISADDGTGSSFIIKQDAEGSVRFAVGDQARWQLVYPRQDGATQAQTQGVQRFMTALGDALPVSSSASSEALFAALDRSVTTDFVLAQEFAKNIDAYNLSLHLARSSGKPAQLVPWDIDLSFGQPTLQNRTNERPEGWVYNRTSFIQALSRSRDLMQGLPSRWRELRGGVLSEAAIFARLDAFQVTLTPAALSENFGLWPIEEVDFGVAYEPYEFYPVESHEEEVAHLRDWISQRLTWIDAHIDDYPN